MMVDTTPQMTDLPGMYVKSGEIYKIEGDESSMFLCLCVPWGPVHEAADIANILHVLEVDSRVYLLIKKLAF